MSMPTTGQNGKNPPPLPPRESGNTDALGIASTHTSNSGPTKPSQDVRPWSMTDPRATSQESIFSPDDAKSHERRKLLAIYIHGFMGNEASFRSFPAHVHSLLTVLLSETHVIHTKIYPRYRSRKNISFARDDFSKWLEPHEGSNVDVVLLGHSMGGLLAAEVATLTSSKNAEIKLKHRIVGTINLDVPFLGMHPGIIKSGLASLFWPGGEPLKDQSSDNDDSSSVADSATQSTDTDHAPYRPTARVDTLWAPGQQDPNYNPSFSNDVVLPIREGWRAAWHFINKHSNDLQTATKQLISSHMEFGGAMANYAELKKRYGKIRVLEEQDPNVRVSFYTGAKSLPRVRFINYYTACTGRPKKSRSPSPSLTLLSSRSEIDISDIAGERTFVTMEDHDLDNPEGAPKKIETQVGIRHHLKDQSNDGSPSTSISLTLSEPSLPPPEIDCSFIKDPSTRKLVEEEHRQAVKAYEEAIANREKALQGLTEVHTPQVALSHHEVANINLNQENEKTETQESGPTESSWSETAKQSKLSHKDKEELRLTRERERMAAEERRLRGENTSEMATPEILVENTFMPVAPMSSSESIRRGSEVSNSYVESIASTTATSKSPKRLKDRRFCILPPQDSKGNRDPCWIRVFMKNVDEVGAHCGLFFIDERYERLVGEVATKMEEWVLADMDSQLAAASS